MAPSARRRSPVPSAFTTQVELSAAFPYTSVAPLSHAAGKLEPLLGAGNVPAVVQVTDVDPTVAAVDVRPLGTVRGEAGLGCRSRPSPAIRWRSGGDPSRRVRRSRGRADPRGSRSTRPMYSSRGPVASGLTVVVVVVGSTTAVVDGASS